MRKTPVRWTGVFVVPPGAEVGAPGVLVEDLGADLDADSFDATQHLAAQVGRRRVRAAPLDDGLHGILEAELGQARRALLEVLLDHVHPLAVELAVEVFVDPVEHLRARSVMWVAAAHDGPSSSAAPTGTRPRSRA